MAGPAKYQCTCSERGSQADGQAVSCGAVLGVGANDKMDRRKDASLLFQNAYA